MKIVVIDGQGGGLGKNIIASIKKEFGKAFSDSSLNSAAIEITAVGTNAVATSAMMKAGATYGATGENAVIYNCKHADVIVGALGIGFANSMHGEISPQIAMAISGSPAPKILIPLSKCNVIIAGIAERPMAQYIDDAMVELKNLYVCP